MMAHGEMTEAGAIYSGRVRHRRISPREHTFTQSVFYFFLDLERVEEAMQTSAFLGYETFAHSSFRRADFHGDPHQDLAEAVRDTVQKETGRRPSGKVFFSVKMRNEFSGGKTRNTGKLSLQSPFLTRCLSRYSIRYT